jgi:dipeptidase D
MEVPVMAALENCEPKRVFYYFEEICKIPHGSGNTKEISDYLVQFAKDHGLKYIQDEMNNVVIYKEATPGYEDAPTVILQGHMDMVCEKRADVDHDFEKDGLNISVKDGYVTANGTTLGGDDGIAVAYGLALLENNEIAHPALEVLITVDEEIGLLGATGFDCSVLKGKRLINLDSEAEGILWVSCAGGLAAHTYLPLRRVEATGEKLVVTIDGLVGGHSGSEIDKIRANANNLMGRFLYGLKKKSTYEIVSLAGGTKDNVITKECSVVLLAQKEETATIREYALWLQQKLREEYAGTDEGITITVKEEGESTEKIFHPTCREKVVFYLVNVPYGVQKMSGTIDGLVETSANMGILSTFEDEVEAVTSVRSSVVAARDAVADKIEYLSEFLGGEYEVQGAYPAWEYRKDSPLRDKMTGVYEEMYGKKPEVLAIHAGLECGLFYEKIDDLDCVSIGPDMKDIHTANELLSIASVERVWKYLLKVLKNLKD